MTVILPDFIRDHILTMPTPRPTFALLCAEVDPDNSTAHEFRILVDGRFIKYLTIDPEIYDVDDLCLGHHDPTRLPPGA